VHATLPHRSLSCGVHNGAPRILLTLRVAVWVCGLLARARQMAQFEPPSLAFVPLTRAEQAIVELVTRYSNPRIAMIRGVSAQTVANQLTIVYRKLGVASRRELRALVSRRRPSTEAGFVVAQCKGEEWTSELTPALTQRERQILVLAERGIANKLIADELGIALSTVSTMLTRARRKTART
jgi:DNA-binding CsgD family transcriptional regulator